MNKFILKEARGYYIAISCSVMDGAPFLAFTPDPNNATVFGDAPGRFDHLKLFIEGVYPWLTVTKEPVWNTAFIYQASASVVELVEAWVSQAAAAE
jgi:hypothetical protein